MALLAGAAGMLWACGNVVFTCSDAEECDSGGGGVCEATGFCSFPDDDCESGRRYGEHSGGGFAGQCVGAGDASGSTGGVSSASGSGASMGSSDGGTSASSTTLSTSGSTTTTSGVDSTTTDGGGSTGGVVECSTQWWDCEWTGRIQLTPDDSDLGDLDDFPVLVVLTPDRVDYSRISDGGADLRFVSSTGNELRYDIEQWNSGGESTIWVRANLGQGQAFAMYFDRPNASVGDTAQGVWDGYAGVWHMGGTDDATSNGNDATANGVSQMDGFIGGATEFSGSNGGSVRVPSSNSIDDLFDGGGTVTLWVNAEGNGTSTFPRFMDKSSGGGGNGGFRFALTDVSMGSGRLRFTRDFSTSNGGWNSDSTVFDLNAWHHLALVYDDSSTAAPTLYLDGQPVAMNTVETPAGSSASDGANDLFLGNNVAGDRPWEGRLDEVRLFGGTRSSSWIEAEVRAGRDNLLDYGPVESLE